MEQVFFFLPALWDQPSSLPRGTFFMRPSTPNYTLFWYAIPRETHRAPALPSSNTLEPLQALPVANNAGHWNLNPIYANCLSHEMLEKSNHQPEEEEEEVVTDSHQIPFLQNNWCLIFSCFQAVSDLKEATRPFALLFCCVSLRTGSP